VKWLTDDAIARERHRKRQEFTKRLPRATNAESRDKMVVEMRLP
jgi:hypothetical protein